MEQDDEPPAPTADGKRMVGTAGMLCRDPIFQTWVFKRAGLEGGFGVGTAEVAATAWLRNYLKVESRSELATNQIAQDRFALLLAEYQQDTSDDADPGP